MSLIAHRQRRAVLAFAISLALAVAAAALSIAFGGAAQTLPAPAAARGGEVSTADQSMRGDALHF